MDDKMLIKASDVIPLDIFLNGKHADILKIIKEKATLKNLSVEKDKDRKKMISTAAKVASSKTFLEKIGKKLADDKRAEIDKELSIINSTRNEIKTFCDELKAEVRQPVTDWENEIKAKEAEKQRIIDFNNDHTEAIEMNQFIDDKKKLEAEKEAIRKAEEKRQIEEQARIEAEKKVEQQRLESLRREQEAQQKLERAEIDKQIAIDNAKKEAEEKAKQIEQARIAEENRIKDEKEKRENDLAHRKSINNQILSSLIENGIGEECAKSVIILVAKGKITNIKIEY